MKLRITTLLFTLCVTSFSADLKICINQKIKSPSTKDFESDFVAKEVLFKNVYETLFYYAKGTNKIRSNIATKLEKIKGNRFKIILDQKVPFHNNKTFFVKKNVDYKDLIFSLKENSNFSKFKILKDGLAFNSNLNLKYIYIELSKPHNIILSKAYWTYLKKINKTDFFFKRPIGTGPFNIQKIQDAPYILKSFQNYHFKNKLNSLTYTLTQNYAKESCDIFWDNRSNLKSEYIKKHLYKVHESKYSSLFYMINNKSAGWINSLIDPLQISEIVLKDIDYKITSLPIPINIKESLLINKKLIKKLKAPKIIRFNFTKKSVEKLNFNRVTRELNHYFSRYNVNFIIDNQKPDITVDYSLAQNTLNDLNHKILCPNKSKACNKIDNLKELQSILLKERKILPLGFVKQVIYYRKNIKNINFDFTDTIDYSQTYISN